MSDAPQGPGWWLASDGKYYPPQPTAPPPVQPPNYGAPPAPGQWGPAQPGYWPGATPAPAPRSSNGLKVMLIVLAVFAVIGVGVVSCVYVAGRSLTNAIEKAVGPADPRDYEVTGPTCTWDELDGPTAIGTFRNRSNRRQAYSFTVRFVGPDNSLIATEFYSTVALDPGQSTEFKVTSTQRPATHEVSSCSVEQVRYYGFGTPNR